MAQLPFKRNALQLSAFADRFGIAAIMVVAALLRFVNLGFPHKLVFDETYYVKDAWTLGNLGYEGSWPTDPNARFESGDTTFFSQTGSYVVHPPLGKWLIYLGMRLWGAENSAGWRFSVALFGLASVWLIYLVAFRLLESKRWALLPALLLAIDGHEIVLSRTALLDGILAFFVLLAFYFLLRDRQTQTSRLWHRPWLLAMAFSLGCATAVKWSGLYFLVIFVIYVAVSDWLRERRLNELSKFDAKTLPSLAKHLTVRGALAVPAAAFVYVASWSGWFFTSGGYYRNISTQQSGLPDWLGWIPQPFQAFWYYQVQAYNFHVNLHQPHNYAASPVTWLLPIRPTAFWFESLDAGSAGCPGTENCVNAITALGNPAIWLAAFIALVAVIGMWVRTRNGVAGLVLLGMLAGYAPWLLYTSRTTFQFYAVVFFPWMLLALALWLKSSFEHASEENRPIVRRRITSFLILAVAFSVFFSNIWLGYTTPYWYWHIHMWLPSWI